MRIVKFTKDKSISGERDNNRGRIESDPDGRKPPRRDCEGCKEENNNG